MDKSRQDRLNKMLEDKPDSWLREEIVRLCTLAPECFVRVIQDAMQDFGRATWLVDELVLEYWELAVSTITYAAKHPREYFEDSYDDEWNYSSCDDEWSNDDYDNCSHTYSLLEKIEGLANECSSSMRRVLIEHASALYGRANEEISEDLLNLCHILCLKEEDWRFLINQLMRDSGADNSREILDILLLLRDEEAYEELRLKHLYTGGDYLELTHFYEEKGLLEQAESYARKGLVQGQWSIRGLMDYLIKLYKEKHDVGGLQWIMDTCFERCMSHMEAVETLFDTGKEIDEYELAKNCLLKLIEHSQGSNCKGLYSKAKDFLTNQDFQAIEEQLLEKLKKANLDAYLEALIQREDYLLAMDIVENHIHRWMGSYTSQDYISILRLLEPLLPYRVIEAYEKLANSFIRQGAGKRRKNYLAAVRSLNDMKRVYLEVLNDPAAWRQKIVILRGLNESKRAFMEESLVLDD